MPKFQVSGDILHAFVIEVEADSEDDAIAKVERGEVYIEDYDTSCPGFNVDWAEEVKDA